MKPFDHETDGSWAPQPGQVTSGVTLAHTAKAAAALAEIRTLAPHDELPGTATPLDLVDFYDQANFNGLLEGDRAGMWHRDLEDDLGL